MFYITWTRSQLERFYQLYQLFPRRGTWLSLRHLNRIPLCAVNRICEVEEVINSPPHCCGASCKCKTLWDHLESFLFFTGIFLLLPACVCVCGEGVINVDEAVLGSSRQVGSGHNRNFDCTRLLFSCLFKTSTCCCLTTIHSHLFMPHYYTNIYYYSYS